VIIFIRNIGMDAGHIDILDFIESGMTSTDFVDKEFIGDIEIMQLKDPMTNKFEFHGLITVEPEILALKLIDELNNTLLLNNAVKLREFVTRDKVNDPRLKYRPVSEAKEKRKADRRRSDLDILIEKEYSEVVIAEMMDK